MTLLLDILIFFQLLSIVPNVSRVRRDRNDHAKTNSPNLNRYDSDESKSNNLPADTPVTGSFFSTRRIRKWNGICQINRGEALADFMTIAPLNSCWDTYDL